MGTVLSRMVMLFESASTNPPPVLPVSNQNAPTTLAEKNRQKPNLDTIQSTSG